MEVAHADIQKRLAKPYSILIREARQEMSARVEVFSDVLLDRQRAYLQGIVEFGRKQSGLLDIKRFWFVKYNKPVYYQPKEANEILRKAKHILVPRKQKPDIITDLTSYLERIQAPRPRIVPMCMSCIRDNRLTVLTKRNVVKISSNQVACLSCAQGDLRTDLKSLGMSLSKVMITQLERQLSKVKSVPRLMEMMYPGFDPTREPDITLYDQVEAEDTGERMQVKDLQIPKKFRELLLEEGFKTLLPVQKKVIEAGLLEGENLLIVSSTSSGKTLLGEFGGIPQALEGKKMLYLSPLVALTNEKYELFRKRYRKLGLKTGIKVGMSRLDVGKDSKVIVDTDITKSQIVCATYEALDYVLRSGEAKQLGEIGTIIIDEIQNLADYERGPELDGIMNRLRHYAPSAQILALSATVGSPETLAKELGLKLIDYVGRPVPLERHLVFARNDDEKWTMIRKLVLDEFRHTSSAGNKGQSIVFTFSRRRAHALTDWLRDRHVRCAVYHGGLSYNQRRRLEYSYTKQRYACVVTTAALGAGVDLPASQVIFESLAMGADWLSTAEFEQMLGRAGRLGKHDRGKVYLIVQPERKYHSGQDKNEDEIAAELLAGVIEDVEPFADKETSAEQLLATICSTGLTRLKPLAKIYHKMLSVSVLPSDAFKHLVRKHMIRVKEGGAYPTPLGRATSLSFLKPSIGLEVASLTSKMGVLDIAIWLDPFRNVYMSSRLQSEIDTAFRTHMPTRLFSGVFNEIGNLGQRPAAGRLPGWVFETFSKWTNKFFNCGCRDYPECDHGKIEFGKWLVEMREDGLNPSGIAQKLRDDYELWAYPGDLFSWLDTLIHNLKAVQRISDVAGKTDLTEEIEGQISRIESPLEPIKESDEKESSD